MKAFAGLSKGTHLFSFLIVWGQKGRFSHAFLAVFIEHKNQWYVIDSTGKGVKIHLMAEFAKHNRIVKKFEIKGADEKKNMEAINKAISLSYTEYPKLEIVGNAIQILVKWFSFGKLLIKNPFSLGEKKPRCQELVAIFLRDVYGYELKEELDSTDLLWFEQYMEANK